MQNKVSGPLLIIDNFFVDFLHGIGFIIIYGHQQLDEEKEQRFYEYVQTLIT